MQRERLAPRRRRVVQPIDFAQNRIALETLKESLDSMLTVNPFAELSASISPAIMQTFVVLMIILVAGGTLFDVIHTVDRAIQHGQTHIREWGFPGWSTRTSRV